MFAGGLLAFVCRSHSVVDRWGFSWETFDSFSGVSICVKGNGGLQALWSHVNHTLVTSVHDSGPHGAKWLDGQRGGVGLINQAWRWQVAVVR